jgi:hypothetical protein
MGIFFPDRKRALKLKIFEKNAQTPKRKKLTQKKSIFGKENGQFIVCFQHQATSKDIHFAIPYSPNSHKRSIWPFKMMSHSGDIAWKSIRIY